MNGGHLSFAPFEPKNITNGFSGQPDPYDWFPYAALAVVVLSIIYATWLVRRDPGIGDRVGSIVADE